MSLTVGSLFSGIGGLELGLERAGMEVRWQSEVDDYCSRVLAKHWPDVSNLGDVTKVDWNDVERVDLICGGFPCQPFSSAGLRRGAGDERYLWPEVVRALRVLRPRYALLENVAGLLAAPEFGILLADLAELGFDAEWSVFRACIMGAPHSRARLFVLAYSAGNHVEGALPCGEDPRTRWTEPRGTCGDRSRPGWWLPEPAVDRMADGVPSAMVRRPLSALGNAVVPQVAEWIGARLLGVVEGSRV